MPLKTSKVGFRDLLHVHCHPLSHTHSAGTQYQLCEMRQKCGDNIIPTILGENKHTSLNASYVPGRELVKNAQAE